MKKNSKRRRKKALLRLQYVLTGAAVLCVAVIALLLVYSMQDNEISGPGSDAGSALLASGGNVFVAAGEDAASASDEKELEENGSAETEGTEKEDDDAQSNETGLLSPEELAAEPGVPRIRIVLDPGHGGPGITDEQELGAKYRDTFEKDLTLKIAQAAGAELSAYGNVEVLYTRETDKALTLKQRGGLRKIRRRGLSD